MTSLNPDRSGRGRPGLRRAIRLVPIALALVLGVAGARAEVPADAAAKVDAAFADLDAIARKARETGDLPRWADPAVRPIFERLFDEKALLGAPPYTSDDVRPLMAVTGKEAALLKSYVLFTKKPGDLPDTDLNTGIYQDEIARVTAFILRAFAAEFTALADFAEKLPPEQMTDVRKRGVAQMHLGIVQMVTGATTMLRSPGLRPDNRGALVAALADSADPLSAHLGTADRIALIGQVGAAMSVLSEGEKAKITVFKTALERTDCEGLCKFQ